MIADLFILVFALIVQIILFAFQTITWAVPDYWQTAVNQFIANAGYFQGWLPMYPDPTKTGLWAVAGIMPIIGLLLSLFVVYYYVKGVLWLIKIMSLGFLNLTLPSAKGGR